LRSINFPRCAPAQNSTGSAFRQTNQLRENVMPEVPVEVKKAPAPARQPDVWRSFRSEMDRVFDRFMRDFEWPSLPRLFGPAPAWPESLGFALSAPPIDISEDGKAYKIAAELPGLDSKDIELVVSGDTLVLKGEKREEKEEKGKNTYLSERSYGAFQRSFMLPEGVDRDKVAAEFSKGVLTITLPKKPEAQKPEKRIEVKSA
jgi:HSP20 family protein